VLIVILMIGTMNAFTGTIPSRDMLGVGEAAPAPTFLEPNAR